MIFSKFGQKRHGWAEICRIVTYFSFLPTMTFFFLNVMVDENLLDLQLIWFFTTMTFFCGKCHFFFQKRHGWKNFHNHYISVGDVMVEKKFHEQKKFHRANDFFYIWPKTSWVG